MFNRQGLDILLHPLTDDKVEDHTAHAVWLGRPVNLLIDRLVIGLICSWLGQGTPHPPTRPTIDYHGQLP